MSLPIFLPTNHVQICIRKAQPTFIATPSVQHGHLTQREPQLLTTYIVIRSLWYPSSKVTIALSEYVATLWRFLDMWSSSRHT